LVYSNILLLHDYISASTKTNAVVMGDSLDMIEFSRQAFLALIGIFICIVVVNKLASKDIGLIRPNQIKHVFGQLLLVAMVTVVYLNLSLAAFQPSDNST